MTKTTNKPDEYDWADVFCPCGCGMRWRIHGIKDNAWIQQMAIRRPTPLPEEECDDKFKNCKCCYSYGQEHEKVHCEYCPEYDPKQKEKCTCKKYFKGMLTQNADCPIHGIRPITKLGEIEEIDLESIKEMGSDVIPYILLGKVNKLIKAFNIYLHQLPTHQDLPSNNDGT